MTLALRSPERVRDVVSVDNAPLDAAIESQFARYVKGMRKIDEAGVKRQADADKILQEYEEVRSPPPHLPIAPTAPPFTLPPSPFHPSPPTLTPPPPSTVPDDPAIPTGKPRPP